MAVVGDKSTLHSFIEVLIVIACYFNPAKAGLTITEQRTLAENGQPDDRRGSEAVVSGGRYRRPRARCRVHPYPSEPAAPMKGSLLRSGIVQ